MHPALPESVENEYRLRALIKRHKSKQESKYCIYSSLCRSRKVNKTISIPIQNINAT